MHLWCTYLKFVRFLWRRPYFLFIRVVANLRYEKASKRGNYYARGELLFVG